MLFIFLVLFLKIYLDEPPFLSMFPQSTESTLGDNQKIKIELLQEIHKLNILT